ncbi:MAG: amidohydrolase family protein [Bdellovibrionales bacterium]
MNKTLVGYFFLAFHLFALPALAESVDFHVHVRSTATPQDADYIDNVLAKMQEAGLAKAVLISSGYLTEETERAKSQIENEFVAQQAEKFPNKFIAACGVPLNVTWAHEELERCHTELKIKSVKVHPFGNSKKMNFQSVEIQQLFRTYFAKVDALDMIVLVHSAFYDPFSDIFLSVLARGFPNTPFVFFHTYFHNYRGLDYALNYYDRTPNARRNVFLELSWISDAYKDHIEKNVLLWYVRKWGVENTVFGSDSILTNTMVSTLENLRKIGFTNQEIETMLSVSSQKVLQYK